ncbi:hypothetical protein L3081_22260 [Colwellia sp. MSW7]|jgi:hypothetical protein|uniref:Uncharacterized protein n=1 Tax=Colwellia maritima TaxID=2912588 RepID=A0ABS9X5U5_9GAMM|nr:hypothetical protein [Colwellia maritima]MCI2285610.1 hypothetical protein [Colwellia maritima]
MQTEQSLPDYLTDDFSLYLENMTSLADPENPDLLANYLANLFEQLKTMPLLFNGMVDQLAMAISTKIKVDSKQLAKMNLTKEPAWSEVKPFVGVHADARPCITEIMTHAEQELKIAVLLIHFYNNYDTTPIKSQDDEDEQLNDYETNDYEVTDFDENY